MTALLELKNISKHYHGGESVVRALDDVSLVINQGEFIAIMGQSGSGKSTLMNIIGCLDTPSSGQYLVMGVDADKLESDELAGLRRKTFGFIFQRYNLLTTSTAEENVEIPAIYAGTSKTERVKKAKDLLSQLGMGDRTEHKPSQLSGGQQQRVAIARALINNPPVILADEPTGALDSKSGEEVMALLKKLNSEGRTVILITHDEKVAANAERIIRLKDGKIIDSSEAIQKNVGLPITDIGEGASALPDIAEALKMAARSLRVNIFRTALTLLGIIIGVAAVITMLAIGSGSKQQVLDQITAMGTNLLLIRPGAPGIRGGGDVVTLTTDDAQEILRVPNVDMLVPTRSGHYTLRYGNTDYASTVQGVGAQLPQVNDWPMAEGKFFTERDIVGYTPVAVVGKTVVDNLMQGEDPIGKYILVKNIPFEVIGVLSSKGSSSWGGDQDDAIFIPYSTGMIRLFGRPYLNSITVRVKDVSIIESTQAELTSLLKLRHKTEDFQIRNMASIIDMATETQNTLTVLLGAVAAISLLVGGIGVMNIMLVSVTERTREIGIRMATGARRRDILLQFNTEAALVCAVGGILGIIIGLSVGLALKAFGVPVIFTLAPAVLAFSCAFATGLLFGYLPARKAASLDPVIALS